MTDTAADTLFSLLRESLGTSERESPGISSLPAALWPHLIDLSMDEGVAALAVDGYQKLTGDGRTSPLESPGTAFASAVGSAIPGALYGGGPFRGWRRTGLEADMTCRHNPDILKSKEMNYICKLLGNAEIKPNLNYS